MDRGAICENDVLWLITIPFVLRWNSSKPKPWVTAWQDELDSREVTKVYFLIGLRSSFLTGQGLQVWDCFIPAGRIA